MAGHGYLKHGGADAHALIDEQSRQIDALVRLGLAERHADPHDARARLVSLTPTGRARVDHVADAAVADWRARVSEWDPEDIRTLTRLLNRLLVDDAEFEPDLT